MKLLTFVCLSLLTFGTNDWKKSEWGTHSFELKAALDGIDTECRTRRIDKLSVDKYRNVALKKPTEKVGLLRWGYAAFRLSLYGEKTSMDEALSAMNTLSKPYPLEYVKVMFLIESANSLPPHKSGLLMAGKKILKSFPSDYRVVFANSRLLRYGTLEERRLATKLGAQSISLNPKYLPHYFDQGLNFKLLYSISRSEAHAKESRKYFHSFLSLTKGTGDRHLTAAAKSHIKELDAILRRKGS